MRLWICNVRNNLERVHLLLEEGRVSQIIPAMMPIPVEERQWNADGLLLLPSFEDYHTHLDKSFIDEAWITRPKLNHIMEMLQIEKELQLGLKQSVLDRGRKTLEEIVQNGTSRLRVHVDVDPIIGLKHLEANLILKAEFADRIFIELVAFPQQGMLKPDSVKIMKEAMHNGADFVGGVDPAGIDGDMERSLHTIFDLSAEFNAPIDLHLHDPDQVGKATILKIIQLTEAAAKQGKVAISHAYCLGELNRSDVEEIASGLVQNNIPIISSVPIDTPLPPIPLLSDLGVQVLLGTDHPNADSWTPFGCSDLLEKGRRLAEINSWYDDQSMLKVYTYLSKEKHAIQVGSEANFMLVKAANAAHALAALPQRELIFYKGRPVAGELFTDGWPQ